MVYADVVYGSRFVGTDQKRVLNYWHSFRKLLVNSIIKYVNKYKSH